MRFCLMKNMCPACGNPLFSNSDMNHLSMMQNRLVNHSFADKLSETQIFDLALFIYNEIISGYGRTILDDEIKKLKNSSSAGEAEGVESNHEATTPSLADQVRREIEEELKGKIEVISTSEYHEGEDTDDKVSRLREQAKRLNKNKTGPRVSRVS